MTMPLRPALVAALLLLPGQAALADGRADWEGYAWQQISIEQCRPSDGRLACPTYHQKWDWKRNQWVTIDIALDTAAGKLELSQLLEDKSVFDNDYVCVTAVVVDAAGHNLLAHHQNWYMRHGEARAEEFTYRSSRLADAALIHIGSKQCRDGAAQDDALYAGVIAGISP